MADYILGADLGTTNVKASIYRLQSSGAAELTAQASAPSFKLNFPAPGQVEQSPAEWWEKTAQVFRDVTAKAAAKDGPEAVKNIRAVCVSSQLPSVLCLDKDGSPLGDALIWMDKRAAGELDEIVGAVGRKDYVHITRAQPDDAFLPCKLLWLQKHQPQMLAKTRLVMQASGWINYKLTGEASIDSDQAGRTQCFDVGKNAWSREIGAAARLDFDSIFPRVFQPQELVGKVSARAAKETGLAEGTLVCAGASDALASMYAAGLSRPGEAAESSGTTSLIFMGSGQAGAENAPVIARPCALPGMPWLYDAPINTTGASIKWYIDTIDKAPEGERGEALYDRLQQTALQAQAGSGGLLYFPYLLGERAPLWNSHARGMFIGLGLSTGRAEILRSILEGTAFAIRHVIETNKADGAPAPACLRVTGGGSHNRTWARIKACALHVPVKLLDSRAADVPFGDALIAAQGCGLLRGDELARAMDNPAGVRETIEPESAWEKVYDELFPYYINMYKHLDTDLQNLKRTIDGVNK
jgi:xylulokinase